MHIECIDLLWKRFSNATTNISFGRNSECTKFVNCGVCVKVKKLGNNLNIHFKFG